MNRDNKNFKIIYKKIIKLDDNNQKKLAVSIYGDKAVSRVINNHIYLFILEDKNPIYLYEKATSGYQVLNKNMKYIKEFLRLKIGGSIKSYNSLHTSYNIEEALLVLEPLNLIHFTERPVFKNFKEFFNYINKFNKLKYVIQRSFNEINYGPKYFFNNKDIDILVNDYYYFKSLTGARSVDKINMRERDNGFHIQSNINIGKIEIPFDIRFIGDNYVDSKWEYEMLNRRIKYKLNNNIIIYIPNIEDEIYSLLYNIIIQKPNPSKSKHIPRIQELLIKSGKKEFNFNNLYKIKEKLKKWMKKMNYKFKKPNDPNVNFNTY